VQNPLEQHTPDYYEYKLVGVVVHIGSADFGHYYSYIDTHRGKEELFNERLDEKWLEYNDSRIYPFSTEELEVECFGGNVENNSSAPMSSFTPAF
jgi:ubiquitin carboxyl-terminal hydrolase 34